MTREVYENTIKAVMEHTAELLAKASSDYEKQNILEGQNLTIMSIVNAYTASQN